MQKAVIFDMDGVLFPTPQIYWEAANWYLKENFSVRVPEREIPRYLGKSLKDQVAQIENAFDIAIDFKDFDTKKRQKQKELMQEELEPNPGVRELLRDIQEKNVPLALATSNIQENVENYMKIAGLGRYFDVVITVEDVERHKPHPDLFLEAAKKLDVEPKACVVVEDAENGIQAAHNAGMKAVGLVTIFHTKEELSSADLVVESIEELSAEKLLHI